MEPSIPTGPSRFSHPEPVRSRYLNPYPLIRFWFIAGSKRHNLGAWIWIRALINSGGARSSSPALCVYNVVLSTSHFQRQPYVSDTFRLPFSTKSFVAIKGDPSRPCEGRRPLYVRNFVAGSTVLHFQTVLYSRKNSIFIGIIQTLIRRVNFHVLIRTNVSKEDKRFYSNSFD